MTYRYYLPNRPPAIETGHQQAEQEAAYQAALKLVTRIDGDLTRGIRHYRNKAGTLLTQLDEVIRAILADNLRLPAETEPQEVE